MGNVSSSDELRSLRAYASAAPPVRIAHDKRMFEALFKRGLVVGAVGYDDRGDPIGIIKLTDRGRTVIRETAP